MNDSQNFFASLRFDVYLIFYSIDFLNVGMSKSFSM